MDKLTIAREALKKYHFWVLCVVVLVVAMTAWVYATNEVGNRFKGGKRELESARKKVVDICSKNPDHPNTELIAAIKRQITELQKEVFEAWEILYKDQRESNRLPESLSKGFKKAFVELGHDDELHRMYLQEYLNFIEKHYDAMEESVDRRKPAGETTGGADETGTGKAGMGARSFGPPRGSDVVVRGVPAGEKADKDKQEEEEETGKVIWENPEIRKISANWGGRTPDTLQVRQAQEDLWVYEALLRIINKVNEAATSHSNAGVKQIYALQIGKDAADAWKDPGANVVQQPAAGADKSSSAQELTRSRYVDDEGEALAVGEPPPYAEFNMMPICMTLMMDQRRISKLLVECANSSMPIEVRRVRLCPGEGSPPLDLTRLAEEKETKLVPGGAPSGRRKPGPKGRPPSKGGAKGVRISRMDISVEILGIIYIYNPPDRDKLGTGTAGKKPEEEPAEPAEPAEPEPEKQQPTITPAEKPAEKPAEQPAEKPAEQPAEEPLKPPAAKPAPGAARGPGPGEATKGHAPGDGG